MLDRLLDNPMALAATIMVLAVANYALWAASLRGLSGQAHIDTTAFTLRGRSKRAEFIQNFGLPAVIALLALSGGLLPNPVAGGYLILQLATLALNIDAWFRWRILQIAGIVEGRLIPTLEYQYRTAAARLAPLVFFSGVVAVLFSSAAFAIGSLLLCATAIGWYRRARQSLRSQPASI